jgi:hypothetical protein
MKFQLFMGVNIFLQILFSRAITYFHKYISQQAVTWTTKRKTSSLASLYAGQFSSQFASYSNWHFSFLSLSLSLCVSLCLSVSLTFFMLEIASFNTLYTSVKPGNLLPLISLSDHQKIYYSRHTVSETWH